MCKYPLDRLPLRRVTTLMKTTTIKTTLLSLRLARLTLLLNLVDQTLAKDLVQVVPQKDPLLIYPLHPHLPLLQFHKVSVVTSRQADHKASAYLNPNYSIKPARELYWGLKYRLALWPACCNAGCECSINMQINILHSSTTSFKNQLLLNLTIKKNFTLLHFFTRNGLYIVC